MNRDRDKVRSMSRDYDVIDVNLNEQVLSTMESLRPEITDDRIFFSLVMFSELWKISIEPGEIQKSLVALLTESCESLSCGGRITIETANRFLSRTDIPDGRPDLVPGEYVMLSLSYTSPSLATAVNMRLIKTLHKVGQPESQTTTTPASIDEFVRKSGAAMVRLKRQGSGKTAQIFFPRCRQQATISSTAPESESSELRHSG